MDKQSHPPRQSTPPGWTKVSLSDGLSTWRAQDPALRRAHVSRLVDTLSTPGNSHVQHAMKEQAFITLEMLSKSDPATYDQWLPIAICRRQRQFEKILAERQEISVQEARARETGHQPPRDRQQMAVMNQGFHYEDIPLIDPTDLAFITEKPQFLGPPPAYYNIFESACRKGPVATVESTLSSEACKPTPAFLHHGLCLALKAGNLDVARYLLTSGAPINRRTPEHILSSPKDAQIPLFELFTKHGWTPNTPGMYGAVLLPSIVTNHTLLEWFLAHGANPNLGQQQARRFGGSIADSCTALEKAAYRGDVKAVRMLLDAGAVIQNGFPLHAAAGACPLDWNPHVGRATPSKDFDRSMIPAMALLVERGADVNQYQPPQRGNQVPNYAIIEAVKAGAVERVRWLLEKGADPTKRGSWGTAAEYAAKMGSQEMKSVVQKGLSSRKWVSDRAQ
ncbi:ankyrin repeat-containing domain protein [Aspergillus falconensis]